MLLTDKTFKIKCTLQSYNNKNRGVADSSTAVMGETRTWTENFTFNCSGTSFRVVVGVHPGMQLNTTEKL